MLVSGNWQPDPVGLYWNAIAADVPALYFLVRILSTCSLTEASVECIFSHEANFHTKIRNQLAPDMTAAVMKARWNHLIVKKMRMFECSLDMYVHEAAVAPESDSDEGKVASDSDADHDEKEVDSDSVLTIFSINFF
eukprot:Pompholyxophrys_punicea_v1_NODE_81_length_3705_cov_14.177534.p2 type:complete len:137 gc:universal NODE_81_length_3705_cov_14.177534:1862-1452(-)